MDPNSLQYQSVDENEPLYRAAMLSGVAVGIIIFLVLGINFVVRHAKPAQVPVVKRDYETSPDDSVNGMRQAMNDQTGPGATAPQMGSGSGSGPLPSQSFAGTTGQQGSMPGRQPGPGVGFGGGTVIRFDSPYSSSEPPSMHHTHGSSMRQFASIDPDNLVDLLMGR